MNNSVCEMNNSCDGPIHDADESTGRLQSVYRLLAPYLDTSFEYFEAMLLSQANPEQVVRFWSQTVVDHLEFVRQYPNATSEGREAVFDTLRKLATAENPGTDRLWNAVRRFCREQVL